MLHFLLQSLTEIPMLAFFLLVMHWMRRAIGLIPVYTLLGLFFVFGEIALIPSLDTYMVHGPMICAFQYGLLLLPVVLMYLLTYEQQGTLEAHRFICSLLFSLVGFIYVFALILSQIHLDSRNEVPFLINLIFDKWNFIIPLLLITLVHISAMIVIAIVYQLLRNRKVPFALSYFVSLTLFIAISGAMQVTMSPLRMKAIPTPLLLLSWLLNILFLSLMAHVANVVFGSSVISERKPLVIISKLLSNLQSSSKMRQSVEEWSDRYKTVFDNSLDMILLLDSQGNVINANRAAVALIGSKLNASGFSLPTILKDSNGAPFNWDQAWESLWNMTTGNNYVNSGDGMKLSPEPNREYHVTFSLYPARHDDHDMAVMLIHDQTEAHKEQEKRKQIEEQLIHSQRLEAVGRLAGGVAHDFNNLLLSIQSSSELLQEQPLAPDARKLLGNIDNAIKRAADLIMALLGFARKGKYQPQRLDMAAVAQKAADLFTVGTKDIDFKLLSEPGNLDVIGDETQLQQVLLNLLLNAKDALPPPAPDALRKISLRITQAAEDMKAWSQHPASAAPAASYLAIRVKDSGCGMSPDVQSHVFEPFYSTKGVKGSGLGLSMAYGCIANHNGWIALNSTPGQGTEITIFLPRTKA